LFGAPIEDGLFLITPTEITGTSALLIDLPLSGNGLSAGLRSSSIMPFIAREQAGQNASHPIELLDGGTGEECARLGVPDDRRIWSARALVEERYHEIVRQVHRNFITAGSQYITTNNYSVIPGVGLSDRLEELTKVAAELAVQARLEGERLGYGGIRICGSLPPLVESYRPDLVLPHDQAVNQYLRIIRSLNDNVDIFLAETMSSIAEATAAVQAVPEITCQKPIWVSWTLRSDGRLRSGEPVTEAISSLLGKGIAAVLFNCSEPEAISRALNDVNEATRVLAGIRSAKVRLGAYANRLTPVSEDFAMAETTAPQAMRSDLSVARYTEYARQWIALGAELIGGCCGIGPEYIADLKRCLQGSAATARGAAC
jgi:S-methylmethionine-dependent homocysteine/selenocysteine methylase